MRRSMFVLLLALSAGGCSALLGLEDRPIDDGFTDDNEGGRADRRVDTLDGEQSDGPSSSSSGGPGDGGSDVALIPCILQDNGSRTQVPAYFCDDFETETIKSQWTLLRDGGGEVSSLDAGKPSGTNVTKALSGARVMTTGFNSPTPPTGDAVARYEHTTGGPIAVRFSFNLREESDWPAGRFPIASLITSDAQEMHVVFIPNGIGPQGSLALDVGGTSIPLGAIIPYNWVCLEIVHDGAKIEAFNTNQATGNVPLAGKTIKYVDLGYKWRGGGNSGSRFNDYENVIISPARVGCN